jgi:hypothetical protein
LHHYLLFFKVWFRNYQKPVFVLFFALEIAIALIGVMHLLNNLFKMYLVGKEASWRIAIQFSAPAIVSALIGAWILMSFSENTAYYTYILGAKKFMITAIKVMIAFSFLELLPFFKKLEFDLNKLFFGGVVSGFFGGLS